MNVILKICLNFRCENYAITLLEQCENLVEVETFLETLTHDGKRSHAIFVDRKYKILEKVTRFTGFAGGKVIKAIHLTFRLQSSSL